MSDLRGAMRDAAAGAVPPLDLSSAHGRARQLRRRRRARGVAMGAAGMVAVLSAGAALGGPGGLIAGEDALTPATRLTVSPSPSLAPSPSAAPSPAGVAASDRPSATTARSEPTSPPMASDGAGTSRDGQPAPDGDAEGASTSATGSTLDEQDTGGTSTVYGSEEPEGTPPPMTPDVGARPSPDGSSNAGYFGPSYRQCTSSSSPTASAVRTHPAEDGPSGSSECFYRSTVAGGYTGTGDWSLRVDRAGRVMEYSSATAPACGDAKIEPGDWVIAAHTGNGGSISIGSNYGC